MAHFATLLCCPLHNVDDVECSHFLRENRNEWSENKTRFEGCEFTYNLACNIMVLNNLLEWTGLLRCQQNRPNKRKLCIN